MLRLSAVVFLTLVFLTAPASAQDQPPLTTDSPEDLPPPTPPPPGPPFGDTEAPPATPPPRVRPAKAAAMPAADGPVVRAEAGNMGMYFRFGGLASLTHSNNSRTVSGTQGGSLVFSQVGVKFVFSERLMLPIWFGTGLRVDSPDTDPPGSPEGPYNNWGIDLGVGLEYHFRIWRRLSPFIGGSFGFNVQDPTNSDNVTVGVGLGPIMGMEYYIGDRVSLTAMYMFVIQIAFQDSANSTTTFGMSTLAGGALNITYYF